MAYTENIRGSVLMTAAMAGFVCNDSLVKAITADLPLYQTILLRGIMTIALLIAVAPALGGISFRLPRRDLLLLATRTLVEIGATITFLTALMHMPLANLTAILQFMPLAMTLGAAFFLNETVGWRRSLAIIAGFIGILLIVRPGAAGFNAWTLLAILSMVFVVVRDLMTRLFHAKVSTVTVALSGVVPVTLIGAAVTAFSGWEPIRSAEFGMIASASVFLVIGYVCVVMATRMGDVSFTAPFRYTALIFAVFLGWAIFGDLPDGLTLLGGLIVVASGTYTFYRERHLGRPARLGVGT